MLPKKQIERPLKKILIFNKVTKECEPLSQKKSPQIYQKYNYQPNKIARSFVNNKSYVRGFILSQISNLYFPQILESLEEEANKYLYNIVLQIKFHFHQD